MDQETNKLIDRVVFLTLMGWAIGGPCLILLAWLCHDEYNHSKGAIVLVISLVITLFFLAMGLLVYAHPLATKNDLK